MRSGNTDGLKDIGKAIHILHAMTLLHSAEAIFVGKN
jgi:hypothetical protein